MGGLNTCKQDESKRGCTSVKPLNNQSISNLFPGAEREREGQRKRDRGRARNERMRVKALLDQVQGKAFTLKVVNAHSCHVCMYAVFLVAEIHLLYTGSCTEHWCNGLCCLLLFSSYLKEFLHLCKKLNPITSVSSFKHQPK